MNPTAFLQKIFDARIVIIIAESVISAIPRTISNSEMFSKIERSMRASGAENGKYVRKYRIEEFSPEVKTLSIINGMIMMITIMPAKLLASLAVEVSVPVKTLTAVKRK